MGSDYSPVGQIYFYTLKSTNPKFDLMEMKSLEDWVLENSSNPCRTWWTYPVSAE